MATFEYYVSTTGNDGNAGTSPAAAKLTIQAGLNLMVNNGDQRLNIKADGTYTITAALVPPNSTGATGPSIVEGYLTTIGDRAGRPIITTATNGIHGFEVTTSAVGYQFSHLHLPNTAAAKGDAFYGAAYGIAVNGVVQDCLIDGWGYGVKIGQYSPFRAMACRILNCTYGIRMDRGTMVVEDCFLRGNTYGLYVGDDAAIYAYNCVIAGGTNGTYQNFFRAVPVVIQLHKCRIYGCSGDGIYANSSGGQGIQIDAKSSDFYGCGGYGINCVVGSKAFNALKSGVSYNNAFGGNALGNKSAFVPDMIGDITLTADPTVDGANGDLRLNTTAGGGALLRGAGYPGTWPGLAWSGYSDVGPVQHQDAAGGLLIHPGMRGGLRG